MSISALQESLRLFAMARDWEQFHDPKVELLAQCFNGRFVGPGVAWVRSCARPGWYWLDSDALAAHAETLTAGEERRVLTLAAVLVGGDPWTGREVESRSAAA